MDKTVELVNEWAAFQKRHDGADIEDFCRHYLISRNREKQMPGPVTGGTVPPISDGLLLKLMGRINKLNMGYQNKALEGTGVSQIEEFGLLLTIQQEKNPRKTDVIYSNLFELSSGSDMLARLLKRGFIKEQPDETDRRSKRLYLTDEGEKAIGKCMLRVGKVAKMMMKDLSEDDKQLCIQLLKNIEVKFSALWPTHKNKNMDEVYEEMLR